MARLLMLGTVNHPHVEHLALAMAARGFEVTVCGDVLPELAPSVLTGAGIEVQVAPAGRRGSLTGAVAHVRWIRRLVIEQRPDVVHAHWLCGFGCFAALARARPLVVMAWGSDVLRARRMQLIADRIALRRSALAMADSQTLIDAMIALGADEEACVLVNWGVDLATFRPANGIERATLRQTLGLPEGPIVLGPRSLMPVYNPQIVIDAWADVAAERDDVQLVLKHMGVRRGELEDLPFPERVHVIGHVPYDRMAGYYRVADACISIASSDSSPRSVFEAMACGAPCVLSDLPWVHEQIQDEREALIVPIDREALANGIRRVLDSPELAQGIAGRARALVERSHDSTVHMDRLADTYRSLIQ